MKIHAERKSSIAEAASTIQIAIRSTPELWLMDDTVAKPVRAAVKTSQGGRGLVSAAASIVLVGTVKLFAMIEKTSVSPLAVST